MSAPTPRVRAHLLAAIVALLALTALTVPSAALATDRSPTPASTAASTAEEEAASDVRVQITEVNPGVLRPGQDLVVRARLTNRTGEVIENPRAVVRLERLRPGTRADLQTWLDEPVDGRRAGEAAAAVAAEAPLAPGASVDLTVTVPADAVGLLDRPDTWGARGLAVEATDGPRARVGLQRTFALWATTDDVAQARVSVLAPVVGPAVVPAGVEVAPPGPTLTELVQPGGRLASVLEIARAHPDVALAVDPALAAQAAAGSGAVAAWSEELRAAAVGRDLIALPWSDPDLVALAHADAADLLDVATSASDAATGEVVASGQPLAARTDVLWAPGPATDQATADLAARSGAAALVLAPDDQPSQDDAGGARTSLSTPSGTLVGLAPDATLTSLLSDPTSLDPDATRTTVVQRVLAELSVLARGSAEGLQHVLVALPRDAEPDPALVDAVLDAVQGAPWSRTAPMTALLGASAGDDERDALPQLTDVPAALEAAEVRRLADARRATLGFAQVTEDPTALLAGVDEAVLAPLAVAWRAEPTVRQEIVDTVVTAVDERRFGLVLAQPSTQNLVSADSEVRFSVRNDLPTAATVRVQATPRKACLSTGPSEDVQVAAGGEAVVPVAVHAIANCEVVVEAVLTAADGSPLSTPVTFVVRASPTVESVGTAVVGVLLAVGLVLGVGRTVRRGQSARRGARLVHDDEGTRPLPVLGGTPEDEA
ncbi:hypothetical protein J1G44_07760 [Cellulomonas sp. zg-ZUI199]|uniref:Alpha-galactosidase NEW3 domain-containing protein n=1 Tax=Cellulomonas wangleii TaxID=2816956 RepID=A0ABX8D4I9_9CELL|nr:DUF6049 family protein [Cellulomonas wangleii]MBO0924379.1 hypothetical protein [Cellulomonas wangleii]QVI62379.1 hypothetical protein KG103_18605 [Cellulomonas wangleii]